MLSLELTPMAWSFETGHQALLAVYGTLCGYVENPHTAKPLNAQTEWRVSTHRIFHDGTYPSRIAFPVVERSSRKGASPEISRPIDPALVTNVKRAVSRAAVDRP